MDKNIRIARQLVRIAKSLVAHQHSFPSMDYIETVVSGVLRQSRITNNVCAYGNRICGLINMGELATDPDSVPANIANGIRRQEYERASLPDGIGPGDGDEPDSLEFAGGIDNDAMDEAVRKRLCSCACNYLDIRVEPDSIKLHLCRRYMDGEGNFSDTNAYDSKYTLAQFGGGTLGGDQLVFDEDDDRKWFSEDFTSWLAGELAKSRLGI